MRRALFASAVACAILASPASARAQNAEDKAAAEAAFDQGKQLMMAKSYAEACSKFAESIRREPGLGAMLGLADCYEKNGQTASAWAEFNEAAATAVRKNDPREPLARANATRLEPLLTRLRVTVPRESEARGLVVKRDGVEVGRALWGTDVPIDPGVHTVSAYAPSRREWSTSITLPAKPGMQTVTVPALPIEEAPPPPPPTAASEAPQEDPGRTQRIAGLVVGGVGVVGVALGAVFGLSAKGKLDDSNADGHCDASNACDGTGLGLRSDAKSAATLSTVGFAIGAAALAGGAALYFTAPTRESKVALAPSAVPGGAGVVVVGAW